MTETPEQSTYKRGDTISYLAEIAEMSDADMELNLDWIRKVSCSARLHLLTLRTQKEKLKRQVKQKGLVQP